MVVTPVVATLVGGVLVSPTGPALAKKQIACEDRRGVLGVSRVVEIDTRKGTRFGNMQYRDIDFLKPGEVVLTFDDGPLRRHTLSVLNALERHCTKATFYMVGRMAVSDPQLVKEIDRRGHTVATHTWSHKNLNRQSKAGGVREIELGISAISAALGRPVAPFFRFPYLADPQRLISYLQERDIGVFSIDVDSVDFRTRSGTVIADRVMRGLKRKGKGILLFHDIQTSTARGLDRLLDRLARAGYKVVHTVPKMPVKTLAKYDTAGMKALIKRKKRLGERPLAKRSVVWPIALAGLPPAEPLKALPGPFIRRGPIAPKQAALPVRRPAAKTAIGPVPSKRSTTAADRQKTGEKQPANSVSRDASKTISADRETNPTRQSASPQIRKRPKMRKGQAKPSRRLRNSYARRDDELRPVRGWRDEVFN
ncbi:MAG: polysaccharide deacetylase family protein [Pseudomonadota bacterium]